MNRNIIKAVQKDLKRRGKLHTPDAEYLANRLEDLVLALLEDEKPAFVINVPPPTTIGIDLNKWSRIDEVRNYARFHDLTTAEAIQRLVNSGLSHEHRGWTS